MECTKHRRVKGRGQLQLHLSRSLSRSGHGLAVQLPQRGVVNSNRQRNLWRSESVRNYSKYLLAFSSWNICEAPPRCAPAPPPLLGHMAMCSKLCNGMQRWPFPTSPLKNAAECFLELLSLCSAQRRLCFNLCSMFWHFLNCIPPLPGSPSFPSPSCKGLYYAQTCWHLL